MLAAMEHPVRIRKAREEDIPSITRIFNHYVSSSTASYVEVELTEEEMLAKFRLTVDSYPYFVTEDDDDGRVTGFAYANRFRPQSAWKLLETTIYLDPHSVSQGMGKVLYSRLISELEQYEDVAGLVAMISLENEGSISFHEAMGFKLTGKWERCARKFGRWLGTGSWVYSFKRADH